MGIIPTEAGEKLPASFWHILLVLFIFSINNIYGQNTASIGYESAWKIIEGGASNNAVVAVIDGGVLLSHLAFSNSFWKNPYEMPNNIDDDGNGYPDDFFGWNFAKKTNDISIGELGNWHGTPVNGIINNIANNPGKATSPKVKLMNIVKGESIPSVINALDYVYQLRKRYNETNGREGVFIVAANCSFGKDSLWAVDYPVWCSMYDKLGTEGILVVSSVPNNNINIDLFGDMPSTCKSQYLIKVTNTNRHDEKVINAGYGKNTVDLGAPGENSYTALNSGGHGFFGGTSAAAPYVTAAISMLYSLPSKKLAHHIKRKPGEVALLIRRFILDGTDKISSLENITVSGGRLNIFNSVRLLCDFYGQESLYKGIFDPLKIISISPNPAGLTTTMAIESNVSAALSIAIIDLNGRRVKFTETYISEGIQAVPIDLSGVSKGMYVAVVSSNNHSKSAKIIVQ